MSKALFSCIALGLALSGGTALAADLPSRKAPAYPPPPPPMLWTGVYVGLNAGYAGSGDPNASSKALPLYDVLSFEGAAFGASALANRAVASVNQSGFIGGGQIGYSQQFSSAFVAGVEADIQGATLNGSGNYAGSSAFVDANPNTHYYTTFGIGSVRAGGDYLGTVRGRIGYLFTPTLLVYGTAGLAYGGAHASASHGATPLTFAARNIYAALPSFSGAGHFADTRIGWTAGGGLEWLFAPNWSVKAEALYYDLGSVAFVSSPNGYFDYSRFDNSVELIAAHLVATSVRFNGVIARAGVNYHFDWGAHAP